MKKFCGYAALGLTIAVAAMVFACAKAPTAPSPRNANPIDTTAHIDTTTHHNDTTHHASSALARLDIAGAKSLFIVKSSSLAKRGASTASDSGNTLFKITPDGYAVQVTCLGTTTDSTIHSTDTTHDTTIVMTTDTMTSMVFPVNLCNLSDNYLTVTFLNYGTFLVRKSDGAAFKGSNKLPASFPDPWIGDRGDLYKQQDSLGNIYYLYNAEVVKLTITDPTSPTVSTYSAPGDQVQRFVLDKAGNMTYGYSAISRYRHASGSFENFGQTNCSAEWTDVGGNFIYGRRGAGMNITRIVPSTPLQIENYGDTTFLLNCVSHLAKIRNKNKVVGSGCDFIFELCNNDNTPSKIPYSYFNVTAINMLAASDNNYYIIGTNAALQSVLLKVDPDGHTYTNLLTTGDYDIYNVTVSATDEVQFYALRMSDGKRVLAAFDDAGAMTVMSVLDGSTITALERIN